MPAAVSLGSFTYFLVITSAIYLPKLSFRLGLSRNTIKPFLQA